MNDVMIQITNDGATPLLRDLNRIAHDPEIRKAALNASLELTKNYLLSLPPNKRNWPSTGFWKGAASGTSGKLTSDGFSILIDNDDAPGAVKFRHYCHINGSGTITMKDKFLTIPISPISYGHRAKDFQDLFLIKTPKGAYLVQSGESISASTGNAIMRRGIGGNGGRRIKANLVFLFKLAASVTQGQDLPVIPDRESYVETIKYIYLSAYAQLKQKT